eukprot:1161338-Pelagomonas_calceolata.AAC.2
MGSIGSLMALIPQFTYPIWVLAALLLLLLLLLVLLGWEAGFAAVAPGLEGTTLELMHAILAELSPAGCSPGFLCFAGCPFLHALALPRVAWSAKSFWVGITGFSYIAQGLELEPGA